MKPLRWGVLGTGMAARDVATAIQLEPECELTAVGSESAQRAQQFAADFEVGRTHDSHASLLDDPGLDVVYIASEPSVHVQHAVRAMDTGKAVLLEKPFALSGDQARQIVAAAERNAVFCMEAMWTRFNPTIQQVTQLVTSGAIGTAIHVEASIGFAHPFTKRDHRFDVDRGGGALLDLGVYPISLLVAMLGAPTAYSTTATIGPTGVDLDNGTLLRFGDDTWASISSSLRSECRNDMHIAGTEGRVVIESPLLSPSRYRLLPDASASPPSLGIAGRVVRKARREFGARPRRIPVEGNGYQYQVAEVANCIRMGKLASPIMSWEDSVLVMDVLDQIRKDWATS